MFGSAGIGHSRQTGDAQARQGANSQAFESLAEHRIEGEGPHAGVRTRGGDHREAVVVRGDGDPYDPRIAVEHDVVQPARASARHGREASVGRIVRSAPHVRQAPVVQQS